MKPKWLFGAAMLLVVAPSAWFWFARQSSDQGTAAIDSSTTSATQKPAASTEPKSEVEQMLFKAAGDLVSAQPAEEKDDALSRLRRALAVGSTNEVAAAIRRLLDSKMDGATGKGFKIGAGGSLLETPTVRTFLLDQLALLDPAAAANYAREILSSSTSPDEWAIALRNLARGDKSQEARSLLESKTESLLRNESWQRDPSAGFLEAFDTAVYLGGTHMLPPLSDLVCKKDNQAVAYAAFLSMDRLVIRHTAEVLSALAQHPDWMQGREETRANYFARADVGDAEQRALVESYLLHASRSPAELQTFAGVFPNANCMISHNLLTANTALDRATLMRRDQAALEAVNQWLGDPLFESLKPALLKMRERLSEFKRQAESSGSHGIKTGNEIAR